MSIVLREQARAAGNLDLWVKGLRIAFIPDMRCGLPVHAEVKAAATAAVRTLEHAGATIDEIPSFVSAGMFDAVTRFFEARLHNDISELPAERRAKILPFVVEWCTHRARAFTGADVMAALNTIFAMREAAVRATSPYDFVVSPTSPILPYEAELACPGSDPHDGLPHIAFTLPYNMSEQPAASLNWTYSADGLPIGAQVIGRRFDDAGVFRLSRVLEDLRPEQKPWPS